MNNNFPKVKTVLVLLLGVDVRQFAMLRMAFKMHNAIHYELVKETDEQTPELVLVDGDADGSDEQWRTAKQRYPGAKVVFFARQPPKFTAPYLAKPIKFDSLFVNLRNLQQGNGIWLADDNNTPNISENPTDDAAQEHAKINPTSQVSPHIHEFGANSASASFFAQKKAAKVAEPNNHQETIKLNRFHLDGTLLGLVHQLSKKDSDTAILMDNKPVLIVFPSTKRVLLAMESDALEKLCKDPSPALQTRTVPANSQLQEKAKISIESCIWQLAIWTSNGRLIEPITPNTLLKLRAWPNMTRLAFLPESIRLSAFLVRYPVTLATLYKLLPIDMKDILNFIAVTYTTGFLDIEQPLTQQVEQQQKQHQATAEMVMTRAHQSPAVESGSTDTEETNKQPKGLLQRLMDRLRSK